MASAGGRDWLFYGDGAEQCVSPTVEDSFLHNAEMVYFLLSVLSFARFVAVETLVKMGWEDAQ